MKINLTPEQALRVWGFISAEVDAAADDVSPDELAALVILLSALLKHAKKKKGKHHD